MMMSYEFYVVVCAWCNRQLEINGTTEPHMMGETSHSICEACQEKMPDES